MSGLRNKKPVIACARLAKYGEHHNDHQCEIIETFYERGYLIPLRDGQSLKEALSAVENFVVPEVESNNHKMIELLSNYLEI
jgi:UDP-N-acetylglucosamine transferase subunit ALG13